MRVQYLWGMYALHRIHCLQRAEACEAYRWMRVVQVQSEVEASISYLLRKRETDRYRHFLPRILYETASGGRQAPTFDLP